MTTNPRFCEALGRAPDALRIVPRTNGPVSEPARVFSAIARQRVLLFCPHPDDETLATGLLLQDAVMYAEDLRVICLTDGERNVIPQWLFERTMSRERWARRRRDEARAALRVLGVLSESVEFWALPDQKLRGLVYEISRQMQETIEQFRPTLIVAPSIHDLHDDHVAAGIASVAACIRRDIAQVAYVVHGEPIADAAFVADRHDEAMRRKLRALECHASQLKVSRARLQAICNREEAFRDLAADVALPPTRFRAARRLWRVFFERERTATAAVTAAVATASPQSSL